jgi:hypothetical protein
MVLRLCTCVFNRKNDSNIFLMRATIPQSSLQFPVPPNPNGTLNVFVRCFISHAQSWNHTWSARGGWRCDIESGGVECVWWQVRICNSNTNEDTSFPRMLHGIVDKVNQNMSALPLA